MNPLGPAFARFKRLTAPARQPKVHNHEDQLDGHLHARCGRVECDSPSIVTPDEFEATDPARRCAICDRDWFPHGQPESHLRHAQAELAAKRKATP